MNIELVVNTFWFFSIFTAAIYIIKKRYVGKKEYSIIDKAFKFGLSVSIFLILNFLIFACGGSDEAGNESTSTGTFFERVEDNSVTYSVDDFTDIGLSLIHI